MRSGQLAHLTGVSTYTLRHYERLGLLPLPQRTDGNYRQYPPASQQRIELIQRALAIRFSLTGLKTILAVRDSGGAPCHHVRALMHSKIRDIDKQIRSLVSLRAIWRYEIGTDRIVADYSTEQTGGRPCETIRTGENDNSREKMQNVRGDSSDVNSVQPSRCFSEFTLL